MILTQTQTPTTKLIQEDKTNTMEIIMKEIKT
jgi:hypothetical protein